ncbi:PHD finger protein EHD3 isoform X1 [Gossypium hirsutum]|uniref:PHD finger protein EHD3 isoform X1 n=2 Tax=Gossypium hirsutum TaxID=3635 RepID=A0A1U8KFX7_GOSHI|nr:PHD finger protein EHD3-like isoform X1 [Gossypium hirsutum]XP_040950268.1 PHD finger protein EHD3-like isoform X1 [Gossypium hirsutum]XP_040950269.1 PHD finger protein EHD3-like isoform X1 [Gossypium hirsutum]
MGVEEGTRNGEGAEIVEEIKCFKSEPVNNEFGSLFVNDSGDGSSGASESLRTYKRRRQLRSTSNIEVQDGGRASTDQVTLPFTDHCASLNDFNYRLQRKWRNVVLENMHQFLNGDEGGIRRCIQDALLFHQENDCNVTVKDSDTCHEDKQNCSPQAGQIPNGTQHTAEKLKGVISNGSYKELYPQTTTERCQRVFFDVIISEKFTSLCKLLLENFQGIKLDNLFHLSLINSRMKEGEYERSPMLFASDIQEGHCETSDKFFAIFNEERLKSQCKGPFNFLKVWRKLQVLGSEMISLAKSLSNITSASCSEQVGCSGGSAEKEEHEFCTRESEILAKREQIEACGVFKVFTCRFCGEKADGKDCLVCDSCEEMYHVACIEPALKVIPPKSWYCASCTGNGMGSPHENCVICDRLNAPRTLNSNVADENYNEHFETSTELEENSNCSVGNWLQLSPGSKTRLVCKICGGNFVKGEKLRSCEHPYCPNKYYHVTCLTMKQLKTYCSRWYCPSCLCRACLADKDDDKIVLCDGCDAAYHIYCMKPPQTSIPSGKWFCRKCDAGIQRIQRAKRAYESKLKMKGVGGKMAYGNLESSLNQREKEESDKSRGGMDMLLSAASSLHFVEKLNANRKS